MSDATRAPMARQPFRRKLTWKQKLRALVGLRDPEFDEIQARYERRMQEIQAQARERL